MEFVCNVGFIQICQINLFNVAHKYTKYLHLHRVVSARMFEST